MSPWCPSLQSILKMINHSVELREQGTEEVGEVNESRAQAAEGLTDHVTILACFKSNGRQVK